MSLGSPRESADIDSVLQVVDDGGVRLATFNRAGSRNAFDAALYEAVAGCLEESAEDGEVSCVVLTGRGPTFSAGVDRSELVTASGGATARAAALARFSRFVDALQRFPKPLLAAVEGAAVGVGLTMLGHCDVVVAARSARFRAPFALLGLVPEAGSSVTLPTRMGAQAAAHLLLTSDWLAAEDAGGLVWKVVDDAGAVDAALAVAHQIAQAPVQALVSTKALVRAGAAPAVDAARAREDAALNALLSQRGPGDS